MFNMIRGIPALQGGEEVKMVMLAFIMRKATAKGILLRIWSSMIMPG
jgi:hypothetical protein